MPVLVKQFLWYYRHQSLRIGNNCTIKKECFGCYMLQLGQIWYQDTGKKNKYHAMHRNLTWWVKHGWVKPVFTSCGYSSIRAPACLLVVQLSSAEQGCLHHCSLAKHRNIFPLLGLQSKGRICEQSAASSASSLRWHWVLGTPGVSLEVPLAQTWQWLCWSGSGRWQLGDLVPLPPLSWISSSKFVGFWVPQFPSCSTGMGNYNPH